MSQEDAHLVERALAKDGDAFKRLYDKYVKKIYNLVLRLVGSQQETEELTQEVFFQAYKNLSRFEGKSQFYTWLYRVATNTTLQFLRKRGRERGDASYEFLAENAPQTLRSCASGDPSDEIERREVRGCVRDALESLPYNQKMVMVLGPIQGLSYEEMAEILGVSVTVIKGRLHRARENLRERYNLIQRNARTGITFTEERGLRAWEAFQKYEEALPDSGSESDSTDSGPS